MIEFKYLSIAISFFLGLLVVRYIRKYDVYEKEPYIAMLLVTIAGGTISIIVAKYSYHLLNLAGLSYKNYFTFWGMFAIVGPVEELSKLVTMLLLYPFLKRKMNELNDGIIYISCIALGFSLIENYQYANSAPGNEHLLFVRLFISTPMHIAFSSFMGLAFYKVFKEKKHFKILIYSFIWASFLHGLFDGVLTLQALYFMVLFVIVIIFNQNLILLRLSNALSPFRKSFTETIEGKEKTSNIMLHCPNCNHNEAHQAYYFNKIMLFNCNNCNSYFASKKNIYRILNHFAPSFKNLSKKLYPVEFAGESIYTLKTTFFFKEKKSTYGFFREEDALAYFKSFKNRAVESFYTSLISPARYIAIK